MSNDLPIIIFEPRAARRLSHSGDCACADNWTTSPASFSAPQFDPAATYLRTPNLYHLPLDETYTLLFDRLSVSSCAVVNQATLSLLDTFTERGETAWMETTHALEAVKTLVELGFLQSAPAAQRRPEFSSLLTAWLHITDQCNLACPYCYLPKSGEAMSVEVGKAAIEAVFRSAQLRGFQSVKLKYSGGEATLNFRRILEMQDQAVKLATASGIALECIVLTNGVGLSSHMIAELKSRAMPIMVSLDGIGPTHDAQRTFADGRGSFNRVAHTIEQLIAAGYPPQISVTITDRNVSGLTETLEWILHHGLQFSLNFYRETDFSASFKDLNLVNGQLIKEMRRAYTVIAEQLPPYSLAGSLLDRTHLAGQHAHACGAAHNYLAINQRGEVSLCHMQLDQPVSNIWADDPLACVQSTNDRLTNLRVEEKSSCRECAWRYLCAGGCPLATFRSTERWDTPSPYCHVYQALLPEAVKLEGLRLLKYYGPQAIEMQKSM